MAPKSFLAVGAGALLTLLAGAAVAGPIESLRPGEWYEVPNSHLRQVAPKEGQFAGTWGVEGPTAVINDWSGAAFDSRRGRLVVWGGGHGGYGGNEVYAFDLATLAWKRLSDPSTPPAVDVPYAPDGGPTSRHTYDMLVYVPPPVDRFCTIGGAGFFQSGQTGTDHVDCFDFDANKWETQRFPDLAGNHIGTICAADPVTGHVWAHVSFDATLAELDPAARTWTKRGGSYYLDYYKTAEIDPRRRKFVAVGKGDVISWDIGAAGTIAPVKLTTTGDTGILAAASPGLTYDSVSDKLVAWGGGAEVYTLDLDTRVWRKVAPAASNTVMPTAPNENGTFGRFRYLPQQNAFVVVNGVDEDVFVYKLTAGGGVDAGVYPEVGATDGGRSDAVVGPTSDASAHGGAGGKGGGGTAGDGGAAGGGEAGASAVGGTGGSGGVGGSSVEPPPRRDAGTGASSGGAGCGCRTAAGGGNAGGWLLGLAAAAIAARTARRGAGGRARRG